MSCEKDILPVTIHKGLWQLIDLSSYWPYIYRAYNTCNLVNYIVSLVDKDTNRCINKKNNKLFFYSSMGLLIHAICYACIKDLKHFNAFIDYTGNSCCLYSECIYNFSAYLMKSKVQPIVI